MKISMPNENGGSGRTVVIGWAHYSEKQTLKDNEGRVVSKIPAGSVCYLRELKVDESTPPVVIGTGQAQLHKGDRFSAPVGRFYSLRKLMENLGFNHAQRASVFAQLRQAGVKFAKSPPTVQDDSHCDVCN